MTRSLSLAVLVCALASVARADAPVLAPDAQAHMTAGLESYDAGDYEAASRELEAAYAIDPKPVLLYAWAQAERRGGHCDRAVDLYHRYLATTPNQAQVDAANSALAQCATATAAAATAHAEPHESRAPRETRTRLLPWYGDLTADALAGGGAIVVGIGAGFVVASSSALDRAKSATTLEAIHADLDEATTRRHVAVTALITGALVGAGGVVLYTRCHRRVETYYVASDGHTLALGGRF